MMNLTLRLLILAGAVLIIGTVLRSIRKKRILMSAATGWVCLGIVFLLVALFPGIVTSLSALLGFQSPANFVFFVVTGLLVVKAFRDSAHISLMRRKIEELAQEVALRNAGSEDNRHESHPS